MCMYVCMQKCRHMYVCMYVCISLCILNNAAHFRLLSNLTGNKKIQLIFPILLPYMFCQPICPSNSIYVNLVMCIYETSISIYKPHMTKWNQKYSHGHWCTCTSYFWQVPLNKYACNIAHTHSTALLLLHTYRSHICTTHNTKEEDATYICHAIAICVPETIYPSNTANAQMCRLLNVD